MFLNLLFELFCPSLIIFQKISHGFVHKIQKDCCVIIKRYKNLDERFRHVIMMSYLNIHAMFIDSWREIGCLAAWLLGWLGFIAYRSL